LNPIIQKIQALHNMNNTMQRLLKNVFTEIEFSRD